VEKSIISQCGGGRWPDPNRSLSIILWNTSCWACS